MGDTRPTGSWDEEEASDAVSSPIVDMDMRLELMLADEKKNCYT